MSSGTQTATSVTAASWEESLRLGLLGPLVVYRDSAQVELTGPKRRALLTLLALSPGQPVSVDRIIESLWPDRTSGREESTLRVHISHLRDVLESDRDSEPRQLVTSGSAYMLSDADLDVDIDRFEELTRTAHSLVDTEPEKALELLDEGLRLWRGRPLQDVEYEEFAQEPIRRLEAGRITALEDRAGALIALDRDTEVVDDLEAMAHVDPNREQPTLLLMQALYRTGRQADALRAARRHGRSLGELGLEVSPRIVALEERILQHDTTLLPEGSHSPADLKIGGSIRGYELREQAGSGAVGIVYRAFQASVGRDVAIKVVDPSVAGAPEFVRLFAEEAQTVARLEHPHIVPLYDFWREPAGSFLVMRWMTGDSLERRADDFRQAPDITRVFGQIADAVSYAHEAGVIHRDIKPSNVLLDGSGNAYICDFGLAVTVTARNADAIGRGTVEPAYASPELLRGEVASVASDIYALGAMLAEHLHSSGVESPAFAEVVAVATATDPADRYPDMASFAAALREVTGPAETPKPRRVRRNPYKGLEPFTESDHSDFYGRDRSAESILHSIGANGLTSVVGASGSGKSSVVRAGVVPELRKGALPGSEDWFIVRMVPGVDPFEELQIALREAAVGGFDLDTSRGAAVLRSAFSSALDGPRNRSLLIIDQFEELFSSEVDENTRDSFIDNIVDLATDPIHQVRVVLTLRADFSDRPLAHPELGELMSRSTTLLPPMRPDEVDDAIRKPAARVGLNVEPGLVAEILRDVSSSPAYLPLLQYVLAELFERRVEDRLTVAAYRELGGAQGVLERSAEATYAGLSKEARAASRQLFLRMVHLGDGGEETRRRLPMSEVKGLAGRAAMDETLDAYTAARLITFDRDPLSRAPTVEVAHETVISRWARYRVWIEEARADVFGRRRITAAADTWLNAGEDPSYLLSGGPLSSALSVVAGGRIELNETETRFVEASQAAADELERREQLRQRREEEAEQRSKRRLLIGVGAIAVALVVGVLAVFAFVQRQRANDLAEAQERETKSRELASASLANLDSADPDLSLLLAVEAAELSLDAGEDVLPEVVDALHRAVINPRPDLVIEGAGSVKGGQIISYSLAGVLLAYVTQDGGAAVIDPNNGEILGEIDPIDDPVVGVDFNFDSGRVLTVHRSHVRIVDWRSGEVLVDVEPDSPVTTAVFSPDGHIFAVGLEDGRIEIRGSGSGSVTTVLEGHDGPVRSVDFNPREPWRLVSGGQDHTVRIWAVAEGEEILTASTPTVILAIAQVAWHPYVGLVAVATEQGENILINANTGERVNSFGNGQNFFNAVSYDRFGRLMVGAGGDGVARIYGTLVGGESAIELPTGGVPLRDAEFAAVDSVQVTTVGVDGKIRFYRDLTASESVPIETPTLYPTMDVADDGGRFVINANALQLEIPADFPSTIQVIDTDTREVILERDTWRSWYTAGSPAISGDGNLIAYAGPTGDIVITDVDSGADLVIESTEGWADDLDFNSAGTLLAGASLTGEVGVWDARTGDVVAILEGHGDRTAANSSVPDAPADGMILFESAAKVNGLGWMPGQDRLASAGFDGTIRLWDPHAGTGEIIHEFPYEAYTVAFSPDGSSLAAVDRSGTVVEIDPDAGAVLRELESTSSAMELAYAPDGSHLLGTGQAGALMWDLSSGNIERTFRGAVYNPRSGIFIDGGSQILVASGEGAIRGYHLRPEDLVDLARSRIGRDLTDDECARYLGGPCN